MLELRASRTQRARKPRYWRMGALIRRARLVKGLDTKDIAARIGVNVGHWWRIENGYTMPKHERLAVIADTMDLSIEDLIRAAEASADEPPAQPQAQAETAPAQGTENTIPKSYDHLLRFFLEQEDARKPLILAAMYTLGSLDTDQLRREVAVQALRRFGIRPDDLAATAPRAVAMAK